MLVVILHMQRKPLSPQPKTRPQQVSAGSITLAGPDPDWGLQPPGQLTEKQSRKLLERVEDNFLAEMLESLTRGEAMLNLLTSPISCSALVSKTGGSLGCSDHTLVELSIFRGTGRVESGP